MVEMTMSVSDTLAPKLRRMNQWLPAVLELSLAGFKTPTTETVAEVIAFLSKGPAPKQVAAFKIELDGSVPFWQRATQAQSLWNLALSTHAGLSQGQKLRELMMPL